MKYRQSTIPKGKSYVHGAIDPHIANLIGLCKTKGLNPLASCAGIGPAPSTQRISHDLWSDQPYIAFNPKGNTCNIKDLFNGVEKYQVNLPGDQILLSIEVMTTNGQISANNDDAADFCKHHEWDSIFGINLHMFYSRFGSFEPISLFPAMSKAGIPGLDKWLMKMRRLWLKQATLAITSMPFAK